MKKGSGPRPVDNVTIEVNSNNKLQVKLAHNAFVHGRVNFNGTGTIVINDSYNVTSISDNGVGDYTVNWDVNFANTGYSVSGMAQKNATEPSNLDVGMNIQNAAGNPGIGGVRIRTHANHAAFDCLTVCCIATGDQ